MAATLYTNEGNPRASKILIAAAYSGSAVKVCPEFKFGQTNTEAAFLAKFPLGRVPALSTACGKNLFESSAIAAFVAGDKLSGANAYEKACVAQFVSLADDIVYNAASTCVYPALSIMPFNKNAAEKAMADMKRVCAYLNDALRTRTFLVGERVSLADITMATTLQGFFTTLADAAFRASYPNLTRWFVTCVNQAQFKGVLGEVVLCEKAQAFDQTKYAALVGGGANKKAEAPKAAKAPKAPKAKEQADEPMDDTPKEESKDPLAALPKSSFDLDAFKRSYSNEETSKALEHFWANLDKEGYSIWYGVYNYPEELAAVFQSCNLMSGMFQRLDKLRKHAFGIAALFGTSNDSEIRQLWVWKGQENAFEQSPDWQVDSPSYTWTKLDVNSAETKERVHDYFSWEGEFKDVTSGRKFNQGKVFK